MILMTSSAALELRSDLRKYLSFNKLEIRAKAELALGAQFDRRSYHDFILDQGLLPPGVLEKAVMEEYVPSRSAVVAGQDAR